MHIFSYSSTSSSSSNPSFTLFTPSQNLNTFPKFSFKVPIKTLIPSTPISSFIPCSSKQVPPVLEQNPLPSQPSISVDEEAKAIGEKKELSEPVLVVRRPVMEVSGEEMDGGETETEMDGSKSASIIDAGLKKFAKKMPIFEPERIGTGSQEKPLKVNLDLALYKSKILARNYQYEEAAKILQKCIYYWSEDGRPYVALGKIMRKQSRTAEARTVFERGIQATQGENPFIWQCWAVLENKLGNIRKARELFDAATVADKKHIAAWHGWAVLELKQGNIKKARQLLAKGLKYCGGNEYVYQTLALLEAKANRYDQARRLFKQATKCNPKSCASWLAWAQLEIQQENNRSARQLFEKAIQSSPKNRFAWHVWGVFEANRGYIDKGRKLLKIGHALNPRDPVLLQSLALLEYRYATANLARVLFRRASELDPKHQPVWIAWGWMEWKEGNLATARELYQKALSIDSTTECAARCLQAWGVLEQRCGNLSAARRLFRSSLNINSQSYITWMTWASLEEDQGNSIRADEIRNVYFQQRTELVDDSSWVMGFLDIIDPAVDSIKRLLNMDKDAFKVQTSLLNARGASDEETLGPSSPLGEGNEAESVSGFDLDAFISEKLSIDPLKLDVQLDTYKTPFVKKKLLSPRRIWKSGNKPIRVPV